MANSLANLARAEPAKNAGKAGDFAGLPWAEARGPAAVKNILNFC
jgi:hypothetical protein